MSVRVATINLCNDRARWAERRWMIVDQIADLSIDLIGLQEVVNPLGRSSAHELADELGGYSVHVSPKTGRSRSREGIAILSRLPVGRHEILDLEGQERTAQLVEVDAGGVPLAFVNGHYYWMPGGHAARTRQVGRLVDWLARLPGETRVVAVGDFNGTPESPAISAIRRPFRSAHEARHGREPEFTFPSPWLGGSRLRSVATRWGLQLFSNRKGGPWRGTLDYVFVRPDARVVDCAVILDRPSPDDPTLYASDHLGLVATIGLGEIR